MVAGEGFFQKRQEKAVFVGGIDAGNVLGLIGAGEAGSGADGLSREADIAGAGDGGTLEWAICREGRVVMYW